jgi:hypothetical protein
LDKFKVKSDMSDEERRKNEKPVVPIQEALNLVEQHWGHAQSSFTQVKWVVLFW